MAGAATQVEDPRFRAPGQGVAQQGEFLALGMHGAAQVGRSLGAELALDNVIVVAHEPTPGEKPGAPYPGCARQGDSRAAQRNSQGCCWR
ncbi:hypothetical protein P4112_22155 [Pseudomonas aeruginosa]|nr:hypothetical protein [Pseudomonas aeruginosa]